MYLKQLLFDFSQRALILNILWVSVFLILCFLSGLVAYSKYFDCDPIKAKVIRLYSDFEAK